MDGGAVWFGGRAEFDIVFADGTESRQLSECVIYGVHWKIFDEVVSAEEIQSLHKFCTSETARKEVEAKQKAEKFVADVLALKGDKKYSHL
jgi:hypothetical protein